MRFIPVIALLAAFVAPAYAGPPPADDQAAPVDAPPFGTPDPGWSADPGFVVRVRPAHLGAKRYVVDALPIVEIHYGDQLQLSLNDGAKYSALRGKSWAIGPVAEYRQSFTDDLPRGARDVDDAIEVGGFASYRLPFGEVEGRLRKAVTGYRGWSGDLSFDTGTKVGPKWIVGAEARVAWADSNFTNDYFGLRPGAAHRIGLPRFLENDFWTAGGELGVARRIGPHMQFVVSISEDRILGPIGHTPLLRSRDLASFALGVTYHFSAH